MEDLDVKIQHAACNTEIIFSCCNIGIVFSYWSADFQNLFCFHAISYRSTERPST